MAEHLLGASIAAYRKKAGMTQEDLGRALFVSGQAVSRWERGGTPDSDMLPKIADVLGISPWTRSLAAARPRRPSWRHF